LVLNAKGAPDIALAAVAADEIVGCDHFVAAAFYIDDFASYFVAVLLKPFLLDALARKVRSILDSPADSHHE